MSRPNEVPASYTLVLQPKGYHAQFYWNGSAEIHLFTSFDGGNRWSECNMWTMDPEGEKTLERAKAHARRVAKSGGWI